MSAAELFRALGNEKRLAILGWLRDPVPSTGWPQIPWT
jgi:hypothetical protein